jgi:hypothetical protein
MRSGGPAQPKQAYAHDAVLLMAPGGDERAPGGAVTLTLCGSWSHEPPCPLAPHHTAVSRTGDELRVRVLFAAAPRDEERVRALIDAALRSGGAPTPDGPPATWRLTSSAASSVRADERDHGDRLTRG